MPTIVGTAPGLPPANQPWYCITKDFGLVLIVAGLAGVLGGKQNPLQQVLGVVSIGLGALDFLTCPTGSSFLGGTEPPNRNICRDQYGRDYFC
jgi:hypothetical protein